MPRTQAAVPRRSCRQPAASRRPQGGAGAGASAARSAPQSSAAIEDREIESVIRKQEAVGLQVDHRRRVPPRVLELRFPRPARRRRGLSRRAQDQVPGPAAQADDAARDRQARRLSAAHPMIEHFKFVAAHTKATPKMTIPSPSSLHFRYGRDAVPAAIYPAMDDFYRDLGESYRKAVRAFADAGCRYLQLDEVNFTYLCDPKLRELVTDRGDDPERAAAHLCAHDQRGDLRRARRHDHRDASLPRQLPVDLRGLGRLRAGGRDPVQRDQDRRLFHGIRQRARRRLRAAALRAEGQDGGARPRHLEERHARNRRTSSSAASTRRRSSSTVDQLCLSPQCGFASTEEGNILAEDEQWAKLRRIVEVAEEVWG